MTPPILIISMLHEGAVANSANHLFRGEPVLAWTLRRLAKVRRIESTFILCWDDQAPAVEKIHACQYLTAPHGHGPATLEIAERVTTALEIQFSIACKGRRHAVPELDAIAASAKWMDGWRGGLLQSCDFDAGFHGRWITELTGDADVLLIDPAAGFADPVLIDALIDRAESRPDLDLFFSQTPPGLSGAIVRNSLLVQLAEKRQHPGKLLHYLPERPSRDPIAAEACVEVPTELARSTLNFKLNSIRQIDRMESATSDLADPIEASGVQLLELLNSLDMNAGIARTGSRAESAKPAVSAKSNRPSAMPREIVLELTTRRSTFPAFGAARHFPLNRADLSVELARILFHELEHVNDLRLTLAGVGDPLCHPAFFEIVECARAGGTTSIHVETDLHELDPAQVAGLVEAGIDVISVNLPARTAEMYLKLMGTDGYGAVINNIKQLVLRRQGLSRGTPIVVPTFVKCRENMGEMESWYDQWLRALGVAVITGPSDCAGQIPQMAVGEMAPPRRKPCGRLAHRMTILADGRIVSCEQDVFGRQVLGEIGRDCIADVWAGSFESMREDHRAGAWQKYPLCATCREWHRP